MFLWWPSTKNVQAIWIRQKTWLPGGGAYFPYIIYIENFKNLLVRNHWTDFNRILQKCSFGDSLPRLLKPFGFVRKHGSQWAGLIFPIYLYRKLKKSLCQTTGPISIYFCRNVPLMILYQDCSSHLDSSKNMAARERGLFSLYIYVENFKNLLVRNHWTDFHIILQEFSFGDPLPRLFKPFGFVKKHGRQGVRNHWTDFNIILQKCSFGDSLLRLLKPFGFVKKHGRQGAGLVFPIYLYRKLKKSSCQKPLERFPYTSAEMFLWWSSTKVVQAIWIRQKTWPPGGGACFPNISL